MASPSKRREMDLMMNDYKVEMMNDGMQAFYVNFNGPNDNLLNVFEVFLPQLLLYLNPSNPLTGEGAALMMRDRGAYELRVKEYCEKFAKPEDAGAVPEEKSSDEEMSEQEDDAVAGQPDP